jgi:hypothetical protein
MNYLEDLSHPYPQEKPLTMEDLIKIAQENEKLTAERVAQMIINSSTNEVDPLGR